MKKIVLFCSAGMSTSLVVAKMQEAAKAQGYECQIEVHPAGEAEKYADSMDIALIGPQIRFQLDALRQKLPCPVEPIDMVAYGTMDGAKVLAQARAAMGE